ncbi:unnamed protein product, partial [Vitis vinifera]
MESNKSIYCYLYFGGEIIKADDGSINYKGGCTNGICINQGISHAEFVSKASKKVQIDPSSLSFKCTLKFDKSLLQPLDDDDDIYNMVLFNDGFSRVYVFEAHNGRVKQGVIDEQSTSVNVENNHFSSPSSSSQGVNDDNTIQRHEVVSRCIEFEAIPPVSSTLGKAISGSGQIFTNADEFRNALYLTSLAGRFNYKFKRNSLKQMTACCTAGGCPWKITARGVGATKIVRVHTFENKHNHSAQEESSSVPALRPNKAALVIDDMIRANPDYLPRQICEDFERQHGVKLTYNQAWKCKEKAKERIFGLPHNSYKLLPWLCKQLMETNSGTIAEWTSSDKGNFMQLFIAHGFSVHGFLMGCRPIISINSSNLSGPHKGALFSALAYDADDDMFPLAYAIVSSENYYNWFWFLQRLKQLVGEMEVVIISGRHHAIIRSVAEVFGVENHAYCLRHLKEDFSHQLMMGREGKDNALKLLDAVAYARLEIGYNSAMENLRRFDANLAKWVEDNNPEHWAMSKFPKKRWDKMNTNIFGSISAWVKEEQHHTIFSFIEKHMDMLASLLVECKTTMQSWERSIGPKTEDKLLHNIAKSKTVSDGKAKISNYEIDLLVVLQYVCHGSLNCFLLLFPLVLFGKKF